MTASRLVAIGLSLLVGACVNVDSRSVASSSQLDDKIGEVEITVANAADPGMLLPGMTVSVISADGRIAEVGKTGRFGEIRIAKERVSASAARAVVICHQSFFCGAILVAPAQLAEYDEYFITLAPVTVR